MFKEVKDAEFDYKSIVINGYDNCAEKYQNARHKEHEQSLDYIFENIPESSEILDVGCGSGIPVCKLLATKYRVTGIDISSKQIELAEKNVPEGSFFNIDILDYKLDDNSLDAIVSFYALFHIPKEKHQKVLSEFYNWIKPGGVLVITLSNDNENAYIEDDFFDETMYWSNYGIKEYREILSGLGFKILKQEELGHGYENMQDMSENHPLVIAVKD